MVGCPSMLDAICMIVGHALMRLQDISGGEGGTKKKKLAARPCTWRDSLDLVKACAFRLPFARFPSPE